MEADPINPEQVFAALSPRLPDDAMITADSGSGTNWYDRHVRIRGTMRATPSGSLATMSCGVPHAVGVEFARPDRPAYALVGDGAMRMNGLNKLITIAWYWPDWTDARLVIMMLNNADLNQVTWELGATDRVAAVPAAPAAPGRRLRDARTEPRTARPPGRGPGPGRCDLERGHRGPSAVRDRVPDRSGGAADPPARNLGRDDGHRRLAAQGRLRPVGCHHGGVKSKLAEVLPSRRRP